MGESAGLRRAVTGAGPRSFCTGGTGLDWAGLCARGRDTASQATRSGAIGHFACGCNQWLRRLLRSVHCADQRHRHCRLRPLVGIGLRHFALVGWSCAGRRGRGDDWSCGGKTPRERLPLQPVGHPAEVALHQVALMGLFGDAVAFAGIDDVFDRDVAVAERLVDGRGVLPV